MGDKDALKLVKKNMKRARKAIAKEQKRQAKVRDDRIAPDAKHDGH
jgi:hypothetical protein